jgi:hypothetical protein
MLQVKQYFQKSFRVFGHMIDQVIFSGPNMKDTQTGQHGEKNFETEQWTKYRRALEGRRGRKAYYCDPHSCEPLSQTHTLVPTTVNIPYNQLFLSIPSINAFPQPKQQPEKSLWNAADIPPAFHETPLFYQHLIGQNPPTQEQCVTIFDPKVVTQSGRIEGKSNCVLLTRV